MWPPPSWLPTSWRYAWSWARATTTGWSRCERSGGTGRRGCVPWLPPSTAGWSTGDGRRRGWGPRRSEEGGDGAPTAAAKPPEAEPPGDHPRHRDRHAAGGRGPGWP